MYVVTVLSVKVDTYCMGCKCLMVRVKVLAA